MTDKRRYNVHDRLVTWKADSRHRRWPKWALSLVMGLLLLLTANLATSSASLMPTITVTGVVVDQSVTIRTHNFPANRVFIVRMGEMGTRGEGGIIVGTTNSDAGGSFEVTYAIPDQLKGRAQIAIRLDGTGGYYSFNWFHNNAGGNGSAPAVPAGPVYTPTFSIQSVQANESVTIVTANFPPNQTFRVTMGQMSTQGVGGVGVGTIESGGGGRATYTFAIPESLRGQQRIAIRAETDHVPPLKPYYAYNWFHNSAAPVAQPPAPAPAPGTGIGGGDPLYTGVPAFRICSVMRDGSVTIQTNNFPRNQSFNVTMGAMYTQGVGGVHVGVLESGADRSARYTFDIPESLRQSSRISIRAQTGHLNPYYAYNWFDNFTTTTDLCP